MGARAPRDPWLHPWICLQQSQLHTPSLHPSNVLVPWRNRDACWRKPSGSTLAPSCGRLDGVISPSIACSFTPGALTPARRKAGRADSGSLVGLHTSCPMQRSTSLASLSAQSKPQREGRLSPSRAGMQRMPGAFPLPVSPAPPAAPVPAASLRFPQPLPPTVRSLCLSRSRAGGGDALTALSLLTHPIPFPSFLHRTPHFPEPSPTSNFW